MIYYLNINFYIILFLGNEIIKIRDGFRITPIDTENNKIKSK